MSSRGNPVAAGGVADEPPEEEPTKVFTRIKESHELQANPDAVNLQSETSKLDDPKMVEGTNEVVNESIAEGEKESAAFKVACDKVTLSSALSGHENLDAAIPDLWRLLYFLRSSKHGCDVGILPKPMVSRQRVIQKPRKWQNLVSHQVSLLDAASKEPAVRQGRQQAWSPEHRFLIRINLVVYVFD